jgi:hypothetical protein
MATTESLLVSSLKALSETKGRSVSDDLALQRACDNIQDALRRLQAPASVRDDSLEWGVRFLEALEFVESATKEDFDYELSYIGFTEREIESNDKQMLQESLRWFVRSTGMLPSHVEEAAKSRAHSSFYFRSMGGLKKDDLAGRFWQVLGFSSVTAAKKCSMLELELYARAWVINNRRLPFVNYRLLF